MLRREVLSAAAVALLLVTGIAAVAQPGAQAGAGRRAARRAGARMPNLAPLPVTTIDYICTLTADQKAKLGAIREKLAADEKALRPARGTKPTAETAARRAEVRKQAQTDALAALTDEQKAALRKAAAWMGPLGRAAVPPIVVPELKLTDAQKLDLEKVGAELQRKTRELPRGAKPDERREAMKPIVAETRTKVEGILTADQKTAVEKARKPARGARKGKAGNAADPAH